MTTDNKTLSILVVDDDLAMQQFETILIEQIPFLKPRVELDFAKDGKEALEKLGRKDFELIIMDWEMPLLGKGEVLRLMRRNGSRIPVVVISGSDPDLADEVESLQAAFLSKTRMNPETFQQAISVALALLDLNPSLFFEQRAGETELLPTTAICSANSR